MSRQLYIRSANGRTPLFETPARLTRSKAQLEDPFLDQEILRRIATQSQSQSPPPPTKRRRTRKQASSPSPSEDTSSPSSFDDNAEDASDEESESDDGDPEFFAPSRNLSRCEAGRFPSVPTYRDLGPDSYEREMFPDIDDEEDDDIYEHVNSIPDDDEYDDENMAYELSAEQDLQTLLDRQGDPHTILSQLDDTSAFGFAASLVGSVDSTSDESEDLYEVTARRHVHFQPEPSSPTGILLGSVSPLLTRALLPSALPDPDQIGNVHSKIKAGVSNAQMMPWGDSHQPQHSTMEEDPYDTDATVEDLPPEAHHTTPNALRRASSDPDLASSSPESSLSRKRKAGRGRGPPRGVFETDDDKTWGILDASGKKVIMVPASGPDRPAWLEKISDSLDTPNDASAAVSPADLLDESDGSEISSQELAETLMNDQVPDVMLAGLNSNGLGGDDHGQATGPSEAFYAPPDGFQVLGDYIIEPEDGEAVEYSDFENEVDIPFNFDDLISMDEDSDDESGQSANGEKPSHDHAGNKGFLDDFHHINNTNVTSFRRNADPATAALTVATTFPSITPAQASILQTPRQGHKRKSSDSPYQSPIYNGVTPVSRVIASTKRTRLTM